MRTKVEANRKTLVLPAPPIVLEHPPGSKLDAPEGGVAGDGDVASTPMYRFYPMAGTNGSDFMNGGFVDLDPASGSFHDWKCRPFTYDGHEGTDSTLRSFAEQFIGVPVFAARDGVVVFVNDGLPDTNTSGGWLGNLVILDHGDGFESQYWHLKKDSIPVTLGESVVAGQQIGMVGSSGNSWGPHLHFQTMRNGPNGWEVHEPFHGACNPGPSDFLDQSPLDTEALLLFDFGITRTNLFNLPQPWWEPWPLPTDSQIATTDSEVVFWWFVWNFPAECQIRVTFTRPDGSLADDATWNWGNPESFRSLSNWFAWPVDWLQPMVGTWRLRFELNGQLMIDAPFEMVTSIDPAFNRPPEPIGAAFDPASPQPQDVIFCRVLTQGAKEDLDWDVVRYRYVWKRGSEVLRDVTTAAHSDAIPRNSASCGALLTCTVTPSDGKVNGQGVTVAVAVGGLLGDFNCDSHINGADLAIILGAWGACAGCAPDLNGDGVVNGADISIVLGGWTG
ncbi:MAG: peptidoglycan DD-metalloendopeptidase family protein [Phycisphaeraceae bacterium]|nr:peptidoglycan DD-metalloendopeptidase family protein [Phycisphaeraceae bacterium]